MAKELNIKPGSGLLDWGTRGRPFQHGPVWGHHCGPHWKSERPPTDSLDEVCQHHDDCWDGCEKHSDAKRLQRLSDGRLHARPSKLKECHAACDEVIVKELEALPEDPSKWPRPVPKRVATAARRYLKAAYVVFKRIVPSLRMSKIIE